jgi:hypothetical protein
MLCVRQLSGTCRSLRCRMSTSSFRLGLFPRDGISMLHGNSASSSHERQFGVHVADLLRRLTCGVKEYVTAIMGAAHRRPATGAEPYGGPFLRAATRRRRAFPKDVCVHEGLKIYRGAVSANERKRPTRGRAVCMWYQSGELWRPRESS